MNWGGQKQEVKNYETRVLVSEDEESLSYKGENSKINTVLYLFNEGDMLKSVGCLVPIHHSESMAKYLVEKYNYSGSSNGNYYFVSLDAKHLIAMTVYNSQYLLIACLSKDTSSSISQQNLKDVSFTNEYLA